MSGHSKWANIKHRKAAADAKKGKVFTRLIKEITVAARLGGGDPDANPRLRLAMDKAREANMAKESVQSAVKRGAGQLDGVTYDEARYEGYGPGGAAIMVDCLTDNRTRTVAEVRHAFTKNGGNLGSDGSVSYLFRQVGQFVFAPGTSEDRVMEVGLDAGAQDVVKNDDGSVELICAPADFAAVKAALEKAGLKPELAEITMKPNAESSLAGGEAASLRRLLEALENLDDVQDVYTTAVIDTSWTSSRFSSASSSRRRLAASPPASELSAFGFMVISASSGLRPAFSSATFTAAKSAGAQISSTEPSSFFTTSWAPASSPTSMTRSSLVPGANTNWPTWRNR